jgi:hypothetical protein
MVSPTLTVLSTDKLLPELDMVEFVLTGIDNDRNSAAAQLATEILNRKVTLEPTTLDDAWHSGTP